MKVYENKSDEIAAKQRNFNYKVVVCGISAMLLSITGGQLITVIPWYLTLVIITSAIILWGVCLYEIRKFDKYLDKDKDHHLNRKEQ